MAKDEQHTKREPKVEHKKVEVVDERGGQNEPKFNMPFGVWWQPTSSGTKRPESERTVFMRSLIWAFAGGAMLGVLSIVGCAMLAFGAARIFERKMFAIKIAAVLGVALLGLLVPFACGVMSWTEGAFGLIGLATAFVIAKLVRQNRATLTTDYIVAGVASLLMMGVWFLSAYVSGTQLIDVVNDIVSEASSAVQQAGGLDMQAQFAALIPVVKLLLPAGFFLLSGANVLGAHAGARFTKPITPQNMWRLERFDAPTWSMIALIIAVFLCALGATQSLLLSAGLSLLAALRFIFLLQGCAVVSWWFGKYRAGCLLRLVVIFLAIELEASFFVLSLLGLVDFFANFRKLKRARTAA